MTEQNKPQLTEVNENLDTYVMARIESMKAGRDSFMSDWEAYDEMYEALQQGSVDGLSNIKLSMYFSVIQAKFAEEINVRSPIQFYPRGKDDVKKLPVIKAAWDYAWEKSHSEHEYHKAVLGKYIYGTSIWKEEYVEDIRLVRNAEKLDEEGHMVYGEKRFIDYEGVKGRYIPVYNFLKDTDAKSMDEAQDCAEIKRMNIDDVKRIYATCSNIDLVVPAELDGDVTQDQKRESGYDNKVVEVYEYYNKLRDLYVVITASGVLLESSPIPYAHKRLPFARMVNYMRDDSFYGKSEIQTIEPMVAVKETLVNQAIDMTSLNINKPMIVSSAAELTDPNAQVYPGKIIDVEGDVNQIKPLEFGSVGSDFYNMNSIMDDEIIRVAAVDTKSIIDVAGETATKTAIKKESSLKRIKLGMIINDEIFWRNIAELRLSNIKQFFAIPVVNEIQGNNDSKTMRMEGKRLIRRKGGGVVEEASEGLSFFESTKDDFDVNMDVAILSSAPLPLSNELSKADRISFYNAFAESGIIDTEKFVKDAAGLYNIDPDAVIKGTSGVDAEPEQIVAESGIFDSLNPTVQGQQPAQTLEQANPLA